MIFQITMFWISTLQATEEQVILGLWFLHFRCFESIFAGEISRIESSIFMLVEILCIRFLLIEILFHSLINATTNISEMHVFHSSEGTTRQPGVSTTRGPPGELLTT